MSDTIENVLILQGGGSLIAGTSIGGLNAAIVAGSKGDHPER